LNDFEEFPERKTIIMKQVEPNELKNDQFKVAEPSRSVTVDIPDGMEVVGVSGPDVNTWSNSIVITLRPIPRSEQNDISEDDIILPPENFRRPHWYDSPPYSSGGRYTRGDGSYNDWIPGIEFNGC